MLLVAPTVNLTVGVLPLLRALRKKTQIWDMTLLQLQI